MKIERITHSLTQHYELLHTSLGDWGWEWEDENLLYHRYTMDPGKEEAQ